MPTFTINDRELTVPEGTTILQAALAHGIDIPHYCYHPGLSIAGNCRICLVEVEKFPKPAIACNTVVSDGMVVSTESEKVQGWRESVMEFLLINHPLDCPICDQAGECRLQEYSYRHGAPTTRFVEEKEHGPKRRDLGPHVLFDWERCIKCTRCIRFCEEVPKTGELGMFLRGVREEIGVFPGRELANPYSGNVVDICPVGALTLKEFRFRSRVWFVTDVPSVCPGCARGCSVDLGTLRNEIYRITPRTNHAVNRWWICDEGRLWNRRLAEARDRRLGVPRSGDQEGDWEAALAAASAALSSAAPGGKVALLASPRATVEEIYLLAQLAMGPLGGARVYLPRHERGENDELLIRSDRSPNARGAEMVLDAVAGGFGRVEALEEELRAGKIDVLLALGPGLLGPVDDEDDVIDGEALGHASRVIVLDAYASPLSAAAQVLLPVCSYAESGGTWVNFAGRVQHAEKALLPTATVRPASMVLADLFDSLGSRKAPAPAEVAAHIAESVPDLAGIEWKALPGSEGQDAAGCQAADQACPATGAAARMLASGWKL
ncbi:MAG: 2Fe-2S iron-sulfur cluster-binding protein [Acidobacteriota bacterium]|nr:2Fe-2S iron-sulfur cluster-binding protein [Acidobacteriota bacterium]MDQ7087631.1 2Fe-2S iron-sulfur cluster-binding protein [Acidobacteriota bacterium]